MKVSAEISPQMESCFPRAKTLAPNYPRETVVETETVGKETNPAIGSDFTWFCAPMLALTAPFWLTQLGPKGFATLVVSFG